MSDLSESVSSLPISLLHLGVKARQLQKAGIETLADLLKVWPIEYPNAFGLGHSSIKKISANFIALQESVDDDGKVSWDDFTSEAGINLIPVSKHLNDGAHNFLNTYRKFKTPAARFNSCVASIG